MNAKVNNFLFDFDSFVKSLEIITRTNNVTFVVQVVYKVSKLSAVEHFMIFFGESDKLPTHSYGFTHKNIVLVGG